jgi:CheY-like chemotaxis protein
VLIVDDEPLARRRLVRLIEGEKDVACMAECPDGQRAVEWLEHNAADVVLLDVQMPGMDGLETARTIRDPASPVLQHGVPIIAVTAHAMSWDRQQCLRAGMNDYLTKPVSPEQLYRSVEQYASGAGSTASASHDAGPEVDGRPSASVDTIKGRLAAAYFGDRELADSILSVFLQESPRLLKGIHDAASSWDRESLKLHAHSLKSAAATVGLDGLRESARVLEEAAHSGSREDAQTLCLRIEEELGPYLKGN